tara:strand:- start:512 stop:913 length:402 start_codon:yes stop_codon:yes gene_type:complete
MIHGILMSKKTLQDLKVDAHIAVLHTKVDSLIEKQKELTSRVRANEKVVAAVTLLGTVVLAVIGAGYFSPKAEAHMGHSFPTQEWIEKLRDHESKKKRTSIEDMLNNTLTEYENGSDGSTEQEELLQLSSNED